MSAFSHGSGRPPVRAAPSFTVAPLLSPLLPPTIVNVYRPGAALFDAVSVSVELPAPVTLGGLKLALTPAGRPDTINATLPLKPFVAVTLTVKLVFVPRSIAR